MRHSRHGYLEIAEALLLASEQPQDHGLPFPLMRLKATSTGQANLVQAFLWHRHPVTGSNLLVRILWPRSHRKYQKRTTPHEGTPMIVRDTIRYTIPDPQAPGFKKLRRSRQEPDCIETLPEL